MKHLRRKFNLFLVALVASLSLPTLAQFQDNSPEWQRLSLEKEIESRLRNSMKPVLNESQYVLSVNVMVNGDAANEAKDTENPAPNAGELPLSKLGFWGDVLRGTGASVGGSIFSRISQVDVKVILDSSVPEEKRNIVDQIVSRGVAGIVNTRPVVDITVGEISAPPKQVARTFADWILEFKNGISLLLAVLSGVLLLGGIVFYVGKDFSTMFSKGLESIDSYLSFKKEANDTMSLGGGAFDEDEPAAGGGTQVTKVGAPVAGGGTVVMGGMGAPIAGVEAQLDGYEKFQELHKKAPDVALSIVKKWINARSEIDAKALVVLGQRASIEELKELFGGLSPELKRECKRLISINFSDEALQEGLDYMKNQVMDFYVSVRPSLPESTLSLIDSLNDKEFHEIAQQSLDMGALILSASSTAKVTGLLNSIPNELFASLSERTQKIFEQEVSKHAENIEQAIQSVRSKQIKRSVFLEKSVELIPKASPEKEIILYKMLLRAGDVSLVKETALKTLPSSMVTFLPREFAQRFLTRMIPTDRAELIASQPENRKEYLLSALGSPGDKLRDLVESEVQDVMADPARLEALQEDAESIWSGFVATLRRFQKQNPAFNRSLKPVINRWISDLGEGGDGILGDVA